MSCRIEQLYLAGFYGITMRRPMPSKLIVINGNQSQQNIMMSRYDVQ